MKEFLNYYQEELLFLREKGGDFSKKHPEIASQLDIQNGESSDPHTERILESVAFMSANLSKKIDDNNQSIASYLLSSLYPNLINTLPPCSIVKFEKQNNISDSDCIFIPKNATLIANSTSENSCTFKTIYPLKIYPILIDDIFLSRSADEINTRSINIEIKSLSVPLESMNLDELLFYINSEIIENALLIYEAIFSNPSKKAFLKINKTSIEISRKDIIQCGFDDEDSVCPVSKYSNNSFQLFQEMLHFKKKFMFFKILNLDKLINFSEIKNIDKITLEININFSNERLLQIININSIFINSTPIVNLFTVKSDPFRFTNTKNKYLLIADQTKDSSIEIQSILNVHMINSETTEDRIIQPYFSLSVDSHNNSIHETFWTHSKESAEIRGLKGFDTYLSFVDINMNPFVSHSNVVYATALCTNRFEAREIPVFSRLDIEDIKTSGYTGKILHKTTAPMSISESNSTLWSLVSQLSATHISIAREKDLLDSISKLTEIFSCGIHLRAEELLSAITNIAANKVVKRFGNDAWRGFVRGIEFKIFIKNETSSFFTYFFCCILNEYLSACVSINSFVELILISEMTNKELARWNPTSGRRDLL